MPNPIPGALVEWVEIEPTRWERTGHPEDGVITVTPPMTFAQYYAKRALPTDEELQAARRAALLLVVGVGPLKTILETGTATDIDVWVNGNVNPPARDAFKTLLKVLAIRL